MTLDANTSVESPLKKYSIEIYKYPVRTFVAGTSPATSSNRLLSADLASVTVTSDATPGSCTFTIPDDDTTVYQAAGTLEVPLIGEEIYIRATDVNSDAYQSIFKGFVTNVSRTVGDEGAQFNIECLDMKARLGDDVITKIYNEQFNNARKPNFSPTDELLHEENWTVDKIIHDILDISASGQVFLFTHRPVCYFTYSDFDFSEVDSASGIMSFVPQTLTFNNTPVLEAIYKTLSSAGTYRMTYNAHTDKIVITKVSIKANSNAGDIRRLHYAKADSANPNYHYVYDHVLDTNGGESDDVNVIQDNTVFKLSDIATVIRATGPDIQWYSGHYRIDEDHPDHALTANPTGFLYLSNKNWDGYKYQFSKSSLTTAASGCYVVVGCPLYPSWNPATGYEPVKIKILSNDWVRLRKTESLPSGITPFLNNTYAGSLENDGQTFGDVCYVREPQAYAMKKREMNSTSGYIYEAWYPWSGKCLYCNGTGAVSDRSAWTSDWFGDSRNADGTIKRPALSEFNYAFDTDGNPTLHPVPWDNMCPACRGVGQEPWFKITNILSEMISLPPSHIAIETAASGVAAPANRTWLKQMSESQYTYPPQVQLETTVMDAVLPSLTNMPDHSLADTTSLTGIVENIFVGNERKISQIFPTMLSINAPCDIDYIRGNVIFKDKVAILCKKPVKHIRAEFDHHKRGYFVRYAENNKPAYYGDNKQKERAPHLQCYWRPARAWLSCYFQRDRFYNMRPSTIHDSPTDYTYKSKTYRVRFGIADNKPVYEVYEKNPDPLTEFSARPVIAGVDLPSYSWQISPLDYLLCSMPEVSDGTIAGTLLPVLRAHSYYFPKGATQVNEPVLQEELTSAGLSSDVVEQMTNYPKFISWVNKDERHNMVVHAIQELEKRNDIQISGSVVLRGKIYDLANGPGYVVLPHYSTGTKYYACVVKIVYSFKNVFTTTLELSTEEFRLGEKSEREQDSARLIERKIDQMLFRAPNVSKRSPSGKRLDINNPDFIKNVVADGVALA